MSRTAQTAKKYFGKIANTYETQRVGKKKWDKENEIVTSLLDELVPTSEHILDIPCGTGRFIPYYLKTARKVWCIDISDDMLAQAENKINVDYASIAVCRGNIFKMDFGEGAVHTALSIRIMNLLDTADMQKALRELQRVASSYVIFNVRIDDGSGRYRHPQPLSAVEASLLPGWQLWRNLRIHEDDFRMIVLKAGE